MAAALLAAGLLAAGLLVTALAVSPAPALAEPTDTAGSIAENADSADPDPADPADAADAESASSASADASNLYGNERIEVDILAEQLESAQSDGLVENVKASALKYRADALAARLPEQQQRSDQAARDLYKIEQDRYSVVEMLLSSQSLDDFIRQADYLHDITRNNVAEINRANQLKAQAESAQAEVAKKRDLANERLNVAREQLQAAQEVRIERAAEGVAKAQAEAGELGGKKSVGRDGFGKKQPENYTEAATTSKSALDAGADWSQTKEEFVAEWAPRIDAYLAGSPLYGQGENFAKSAWKYCIDPRWSAAISNTESSKGAVCIRPHNAWGWGAADSDPYNLAAEWGSWEEAIDAHARGLANGYGYTITMSGAKAYCPYTWQSWYNKTLDQMSQI